MLKSKDVANIKSAEKILDEDHYGLQKAKERIVEYLAVHKLSGKMKGPILCFAGPPGVGKTSIGKSIAHALGRKFVRVSLGGIRDEAEISGHEEHMSEPCPEELLQGIKMQAPKILYLCWMRLIKSDRISEVTHQAHYLRHWILSKTAHFSDHYLEVPFDLSNVMFITTANVLDTIPPALRDRLEIINFAGYTHDEKFKIAHDFLLKKQLENHGLKADKVEITDDASQIHHSSLHTRSRSTES